MTVSDELKPCPFCGGAGEVVPGVVIQTRCVSCVCGTGFYATDETGRKNAIAAWNTRPAPVGEVVQFRKAYCADWYDGHPDHSDGGGPYQTRTLYAHPPRNDAVVEAILDKLHRELEYPTEACALVRIAARDFNALKQGEAIVMAVCEYLNGVSPMTDQSELAALNEAATQGTFEVLSPDLEHDFGVPVIGTDYPGTYGPSNGLALWATMLPTEIDAKDASRAEANARFVATLVNLYRANKLVLVPSVESVAADRLGKWLSAALDDPAVCEEMKADIREWFSARAVLTSMGAKTDG